jgi:hypothetical protein
MQVHLPTEISFLHNTRYYRLHLHYKRLYFWKGLKTNLATRLPHQPKLNQTLYPISKRYTSLHFIIIREKLFQD